MEPGASCYHNGHGEDYDEHGSFS